MRLWLLDRFRRWRRRPKSNQVEAGQVRARDRGDARAARNAEEALTARRAWLEEAEHTLAEFSS